MTRSREAINQQTIDELRQRIAAAKGNADALEGILKREFESQQEAEWDTCHGGLSEAFENLKLNAASYTSSAQYQFVRKWGEPFADFPTVWHAFVTDFIATMGDSNGGKVCVELEYKLGLAVPPVSLADEMANESNVARQERLAKAAQARKEKAAATMEQFNKEKNFWRAENLCKVFIAYLATLPDMNGIKKEIANLRNDVLNTLHNNVLPMERDLSEMYEEYVEALMLVRGHYSSSNKIRETEKIYVDVKAIYDDFAVVRASNNKNSHLLLSEWERVHQLVADQPTNQKLYNEYVELIEGLHAEYDNNAREAHNRESYLSSSFNFGPLIPNAIRYPLAGAASGIMLGGAVALGLVLGSALTVFATPVAIAIATLVFVAVVLVGGGAGYGLSRYMAKQEQHTVTESETPIEVAAATSTLSSFRQSCSTTICAVFLGLTGCCFAADAIDPAPPTEQQSSQNDQDEATDEVTDEVSVKASPAVGK